MAVGLKKKYATAYEGVVCPFCKHRLNSTQLFSGEGHCPFCNKFFEGAAFTPVLRKAKVARVIESGPEGATACAKHERNTAVANCERCGNFMCGLCRIDADGMVLCPGCFERLSSEGALPSSLKSYRDYASSAGMLSLAGLFPLFWFFGFIVGPLVIYWAVRGFKQQQEMEETGRAWLMIVVILIGLAELAAGVGMVLLVFGRMGA
jgi:ribosomal protein L37AE/L43A